MTSPQDLYAILLTRSEPRRGYPLWFPEPSTTLPPDYRDVGLRTGDVGVVTEHGSFDVFFNICLPRNHRLHSTYGVPDVFRQINLSDHDSQSFEPSDYRGCVVATQSIHQRNLTIGVAAGAPAIAAVQGGLGIGFTSSSKEGALLILPEGADQHDLRNLRVFEQEAMRCGKAWYEFAIQVLGRRIGPDSLYLITGCHKTSSWSLATFNQRSGSSGFNAQFTASPIINGNINAAYTWQMTTAVPRRTGPDPYDATKKNQTVFIRGYKIAIREKILLAFLRGDVAVSYKSPNAVPPKIQSYRYVGSPGSEDTQSGGSHSDMVGQPGDETDIVLHQMNAEKVNNFGTTPRKALIKCVY
ncbi:hypothetical protein ID866_7855 [Astraeus odoratus]|nr:hypothetical protein ID866_7855 [Astraeus odoratus]